MSYSILIVLLNEIPISSRQIPNLQGGLSRINDSPMDPGWAKGPGGRHGTRRAVPGGAPDRRRPPYRI